MTRKATSRRQLYDTLGIPPDASQADIDKAFRKKVKKVHPDRGGTTEAFTEVRRAHLVLVDPARRARYDETGDTDEPKRDVFEQEVIEKLSVVLSRYLASDQNMFAIDLVADIQAQLKAELTGPRHTLNQLKRACDRAKKATARFTRKSPGDNVMARMMTWHADNIRRSIERAEHQVRLLERAIEIVTDYEFERDAASWEAPQTSYHMPADIFANLFGR